MKRLNKFVLVVLLSLGLVFGASPFGIFADVDINFDNLNPYQLEYLYSNFSDIKIAFYYPSNSTIRLFYDGNFTSDTYFQAPTGSDMYVITHNSIAISTRTSLGSYNYNTNTFFKFGDYSLTPFKLTTDFSGINVSNDLDDPYLSTDILYEGKVVNYIIDNPDPSGVYVWLVDGVAVGSGTSFEFVQPDHEVTLSVINDNPFLGVNIINRNHDTTGYSLHLGNFIFDGTVNESLTFNCALWDSRGCSRFTSSNTGGGISFRSDNRNATISSLSGVDYVDLDFIFNDYFIGSFSFTDSQSNDHVVFINGTHATYNIATSLLPDDLVIHDLNLIRGNSPVYDVTVNQSINEGTAASQSVASGLDSKSDEFSSSASDLYCFEDSMGSNLNSNLEALPDFNVDTGFGSKFLSSANFVREQFDNFTEDTPFGVLITFSLVLGIALLVIGRSTR